ncbi:ATP synthase F1, epsilon subunit [Propionibacterium sp. oral taxon 192 str. F0372]|uniref:F0F1 ATP synthase subunit epsilon n=1 Tax=Propionibacterium sp. oral taxon 192 TaxID=671222 RepID=UPI000352FDE5|nr:F0F1 ATP synthase subunit epsilon [Propionibacterium sp. oral taxon 192]EPH02688.1 ATP synthase F1, epsilon subunit [Propionibacterium sp. oral taxon 192 str. F0372]
MASEACLEVRFIANDGVVWEGRASSVLVRTTEGDLGVWPGHVPFMAALVPHGAEVVDEDGDRVVVAVDSGFISVVDNHVSVLSVYGQLARDVSVEQARIELAALHDAVQAAEASDAEVRAYRRYESQVKAANKYNELIKSPTRH